MCVHREGEFHARAKLCIERHHADRPPDVHALEERGAPNKFFAHTHVYKRVPGFLLLLPGTCWARDAAKKVKFNTIDV